MELGNEFVEDLLSKGERMGKGVTKQECNLKDMMFVLKNSYGIETGKLVQGEGGKTGFKRFKGREE